MIKHRASLNIVCNTCNAKQLCLPRNLDDTSIDQINQLIIKIISVKKGEHIFYAQDNMTHLLAVQSGSCKEYWLNSEGEERISNFFLPGDIIGLDGIATNKYQFTIAALEDAQLCMIPVAELFNLMSSNKAVLKRVTNITSYKMINDKQISITTKANQRVADLLLNIYNRLQERGIQVEQTCFPMTQLDISNFLGMAHETVNRILRKFQSDGIIHIDHKRISITNIEELKEIASSLELFGQAD